jgi:hypothetical protein
VALGVPVLLRLTLDVGVGVVDGRCDPVLLCDWLRVIVAEGVCVRLGVPAQLLLPLGVDVTEGVRDMS